MKTVSYGTGEIHMCMILGALIPLVIVLEIEPLGWVRLNEYRRVEP